MNKEQLQQKIVDIEKQLAELKKELEKKDNGIWKPQRREQYHFIEIDGELDCSYYTQHKVDEDRFAFGNYYKTRKEAEKMANYLKYTNLLRKYVEEHSEPIDWNNRIQQKYYLWLNVDPYRVQIGSNNWARQQGTIYASSEEVLREAIEFVGEENLKKYVFQVEE